MFVNELKKIVEKHDLYFWLVVVGGIGSIYLFFLQYPLIRTTGDERVYISQAIEMQKRGSWFLQTLGEVPNYYKGPLHYLLLRIGFIVFGAYNLFSTVYYNVILLFLSCIFLAKSTLLYFPKKEGWHILTSILFLCSVNVYSHSLASQMESELIFFYCFFIFALLRTEAQNHSLSSQMILWIGVGMVAWCKSPLYSVLLGSSVILMWLFKGNLIKKLKSKSTYIAITCGVMTSLLAYFPILYYDWENFFSTYIMRENFDKSGSGRSWQELVLYFLFVHSLPWTPIFLILCYRGLRRSFNLKRENKFNLNMLYYNDWLKVSWATIFPTLLFFVFHPYRFPNYTLPLIPCIIMFAVSLWQKDLKFQKTKTINHSTLVVCLVFLAPILIILAVNPFRQLIDSFWFTPVVSSMVVLCLLLYSWGKKDLSRPWVGMLILFPVFVSISFFLLVIGQAEYKGIKSYVSSHPRQKLSYYNLHQNIWNEWGLLSLVVEKPIKGLYTKDQLLYSIDNGYSVICKDKKCQDKIEKFIQVNRPNFKMQTKPWVRWKTHGKKNHKDKSPWIDVFIKRDLSLIQKKSYINTFKKSNA